MRIACAVAAAALTVGLTATLTPAHADPTPPDSTVCVLSKVKLSRYQLTMGVGEKTKVNVVATATGCEDAWGAVLSFQPQVWTFLTASDGDPTVWTSSLEVDSRDLDDAQAGSTRGTLDYGDGRVVDAGATLTIKRHTELQLRVPGPPGRPYTVKKNKRFAVYADLLRADWDQDWYISAGANTIRLQSRPSGGTWKTIKTVRTSPGVNGGSADYYTKITKATCFRWVYDGSSTLSADRSNTECVKIKK